MAGAPEENTNAEKWTEETALAFIDKVHSFNKSDSDNYHLGLALIECDSYPAVWSYLTDKFLDNAIVFKAIKRTEAYLEARIINSTMSGEAKSAAMAIFYLKNKYGYIDKSTKDLNIQTEQPLFGD